MQASLLKKLLGRATIYLGLVVFIGVNVVLGLKGLNLRWMALATHSVLICVIIAASFRDLWARLWFWLVLFAGVGAHSAILALIFRREVRWRMGYFIITDVIGIFVVALIIALIWSHELKGQQE